MELVEGVKNVPPDVIRTELLPNCDYASPCYCLSSYGVCGVCGDTTGVW